jgi:hypothetical protein
MVTDGAQGRDVVRVLEAIDKSVALQGEPVPIAAGAPHISTDEAAAAPKGGELEGVAR